MSDIKITKQGDNLCRVLFPYKTSAQGTKKDVLFMSLNTLTNLGLAINDFLPQPPTPEPPSEPEKCQDCDMRYECNDGLGCILKMSPKSSTGEPPIEEPS